MMRTYSYLLIVVVISRAILAYSKSTGKQSLSNFELDLIEMVKNSYFGLLQIVLTPVQNVEGLQQMYIVPSMDWSEESVNYRVISVVS